MYDIIIIGAGVAGLTSAIYSGSRGKNTLIIEKGLPGGVLGGISSVTHYPGVIDGETGKTIISRMLKQVNEYKIDIVKEEVTSVDLEGEIKHVRTDKGDYTANNIILANGTSPKKLDADLEEFSGEIYYNAVDHIDEYKNKEVFVVGGSDGALKEALFLADIADKVYIIHHSEELGAINEFIEKLSKKYNIQLLLNSQIKKITGSEENFTICLEDVNTKDIKEINAKESAIFVYIGSLANTKIYNELNLEDGFVVTDENMKTNIAGVFAAGDIVKKSIRQAATAASDGVIAAINASK